MQKPIVITIDQDWLESLTGIEDPAKLDALLLLLRQNDDILYDYIDDALREMIERSGE